MIYSMLYIPLHFSKTIVARGPDNRSGKKNIYIFGSPHLVTLWGRRDSEKGDRVEIEMTEMHNIYTCLIHE